MNQAHTPAKLLEISDVIIDHDPETLRRRPVRKTEAIARLHAHGNSLAAIRVVEQIPSQDDLLDSQVVDELLVTVHAELQRLWEEFYHGERVITLLRPIIRVLSAEGRPIRVVDVGCGTGYVIRWLAAHRVFGNEVELIGTDFNEALIHFAQKLAEAEQLPCRFVVANAFRLSEPADVYLSTGVLHHIPGAGLQHFFRAQAEAQPAAFLHFDAQPSILTPLGAWLFHKIRMRQPISRHDGFVSALRAHSGQTLTKAAQNGAPGYSIAHRDPLLWWLPIWRTMHAIIGIAPAYAAHLESLLNPK